MKLFAFLLAVLVLALSVVPCADVNATGKGKFQVEIKAAHQDNDYHVDACSPFCQCACCAGFSINHSLISVESIRVVPHKQSSFFSASETIKVSLAIWQPPQL